MIYARIRLEVLLQRKAELEKLIAARAAKVA